MTLFIKIAHTTKVEYFAFFIDKLRKKPTSSMQQHQE